MDIDFKNPKYYENRELSWMKFNQRILNEARDTKLPLLDRFKFLGITASNLDEFFMVRVASLVDMVHAGYKKQDICGMSASEQLHALRKETHEFIDRQYTCLNRSLKSQLEKNNINIHHSFDELSDEQKKYADTYFKDNVYPVLTPMAVDSSRPFPHIANKTLNLAALITPEEGSRLLKDYEKPGEIQFATVAVPSVLPRLVSLPSKSDKEQDFILLEQIIAANMDKLFLNYKVLCTYPYRVMRNADFELDEEETADLMKEMEKQLKKREWGEVIRMDVDDGIDKRLLRVLKKNLKVADDAVYMINGPLDLTICGKVSGLPRHDDLREEEFTPQIQPRLIGCTDLFAEIRKKDLFFQHPYDSFDTIVDFIKQASEDPQVLAIKQTLYRVSGNSPIIAALAKAAENGKQVTVLVELKARFDEENNIGWAKMLENAGCHVLYGLVGLKTHSKIALVVRQEEDGIRRYVHLGTGNYNDKTAKIYTDCGILTCSELIGQDATALFNMLSGYSEPPFWNRLLVSPIWLRNGFYRLIDREIAHAKAGKKALIVAKMNSLCDKKIIAKLYEADNAGVEIHLIIRGICCLRTGIPGISENITVSSIVGTFLEHSRIFYFYNDGDEDVYMGSADWMPRNLDRRVEVVFPIEDPDIREEAKHILQVGMADNLKAYYLQADGTYERKDRRGQKSVGSQMTFCEEAIKRTREAADKENKDTYGGRLFTPAKAPDNE